MIHLKHKPVFPVDRITKKPMVDWKPYQDRPPSKAEIKEWQNQGQTDEFFTLT